MGTDPDLEFVLAGRDDLPTVLAIRGVGYERQLGSFR